jgi:hypothetical protein
MSKMASNENEGPSEVLAADNELSRGIPSEQIAPIASDMLIRLKSPSVKGIELATY